LIIQQSAWAQEFIGGIHIGLVGSQVAGDTYSGYNKAGLNAGGWVSLPIGKKSFLQMELGYIQKGSRENPDQEKGQYDTYIMRLGYVTLPLIYRYQYNNLMGFEGGFSANFLLHSGEKFNGEKLTHSPFSKQNVCFTAGLMVNVTDKVSMGLRTENSLFSIRKYRHTGDVWRFWGHGQFSDALILNAFYKL
ncbi:MAG: porin family protein, partial [Lentimicrobiaceae bacterium]|nr:porin family protein [Lentimicrobiaceae bacterium]